MGRERREKEMSEVFPHLRRAARHLLSFCTGCVQPRMCHESADLSPKGEGPGAPKHPACYSNIAKTCYQSPFLEGLL